MTVAASSVTAENTLTPCTMIPHWSPQAQFAGFFVAKAKGFYKAHGLDMTILEGGPGRSSAEYLKEGRVDFATLWLTSAIQQYANGVRLVNLGQIIPRSAMMLIARKSANIRQPADMNGKKVGLWGGDFSIPPRAFFIHHGLNVREVRQSYTVNLFLRGGVDVASAMWYNEYHTILNSGIDADELKVFYLHDDDLNFPEDGFYTLETTYRENPALAKAAADASFEGWRYAFDHPDEALDIVIDYMREANISANRTHQKWMLERMRDLFFTVDTPETSPRLLEKDFNVVTDSLINAGLIDIKPDYLNFTGGANVIE